MLQRCFKAAVDNSEFLVSHSIKTGFLILKVNSYMMYSGRRNS